MSAPPIAATRWTPSTHATRCRRASAQVSAARARTATPSTTIATSIAEVEEVARRQEQRLARHRAAQLEERDHRAGERDRADEDVDVDLDRGVESASAATSPRELQREADEHGGEADEAVQQRDELGHLRHADARARSTAPITPPTRDRADQQRVEVRAASGSDSVATIAIAMPTMP